MVEKLANADELNKYAHGGEDEDFEGFDNIYANLKAGKIYFRLEDIVRLCEIFKEEFDHIEPYQYVAIQRMTFWTIDRYGVDKGFEELIKGLESIININRDETEGYLNMLMNGYNLKDISIFAHLLIEKTEIFKEQISEILTEMKERKPEYYEEKASLILETIGS